MTISRWSPTLPGSARPSRAARARSTAARSVASTFGSATSGLQLVREAAQRATHARGLLAVREVAAAQVLGGVVEQLDDVLDDDDHLVGRLALGRTLGRNDGGSRVEDPHGERLGAATTLDDPELDPRAGLQRGRALGQRAGVQEHVGAPVVVGEEAEALLRVVEPDLAGGHGYSLRHGRASRARRTSLTGSATRFSHALKPGGSPMSRYATARVAGRRGRSRS